MANRRDMLPREGIVRILRLLKHTHARHPAMLACWDGDTRGKSDLPKHTHTHTLNRDSYDTKTPSIRFYSLLILVKDSSTPDIGWNNSNTTVRAWQPNVKHRTKHALTKVTLQYTNTPSRNSYSVVIDLQHVSTSHMWWKNSNTTVSVYYLALITWQNMHSPKQLDDIQMFSLPLPTVF